jgi:hypothetical protein
MTSASGKDIRTIDRRRTLLSLIRKTSQQKCVRANIRRCAFRNAISRLLPKDENRIFIPHVFRPKCKDYMLEGPARGERTWV